MTAVRIAEGLSGLLVLGLFVSATAEAQAPEGAETYWHHWRGPNRNGVANTDAPTVFSATEHVKWKTAVPGRGFSSPVIWGNRIFLTTAIVDEAIESDVDAIVVGVDYQRPYGRFRLGRLPQYVLAHAPCEVWLFRYMPTDEPPVRGADHEFE